MNHVNPPGLTWMPYPTWVETLADELADYARRALDAYRRSYFPLYSIALATRQTSIQPYLPAGESGPYVEDYFRHCCDGACVAHCDDAGPSVASFLWLYHQAALMGVYFCLRRYLLGDPYAVCRAQAALAVMISGQYLILNGFVTCGGYGEQEYRSERAGVEDQLANVQAQAAGTRQVELAEFNRATASVYSLITTYHICAVANVPPPQLEAIPPGASSPWGN